MVDIKLLERIADQATGLECDGLSNYLSGVLTHANTKHTLVRGTLEVLNRELAEVENPAMMWADGTPFKFKPSNPIVHVWLELSPTEIIDFRAERWFGKPAPHGLINPKDWPDFIYVANSRTVRP